MPKWMQAIVAVIGAAVAEYWAGAPPVMRSAFACLPVVILLDMSSTVAFGRICQPTTPTLAGDRWQAVTLRAMLTLGFLILGITADAVSGIRYSFAPLAVLWGYSTHVASTVRHFKAISQSSHIPFPPWADELDDRAEALTNAGVQPEAAAEATREES
jgi:hypothetical protein